MVEGPDLKQELGRFKRSWLRHLQKAHQNMLWQHGLKVQAHTLTLIKDKHLWGRWQADRRLLQINEDLLLQFPWSAVMGILGHETAHLLVSDSGDPAGRHQPPHGPLFQAMGQRLGLDPFYLGAKVDLIPDCPHPLDHNIHPPSAKSISVLNRVKKLLALSSSPVAAEAQAAMNAAAKLMAKHNLEVLDDQGGNSSDVYDHRSLALNSNRLSTRLSLIAYILNRHFFVETVFVPSYNPRTDREEKELEVMGRPENTQLAEYVFHFLMERTESLWQEYHRTHPGGGQIARNSFLSGLLQGFNAKLDQAASASLGQPTRAKPAPSTSDPSQADQRGFSALILAQDQGLTAFVRHRHPRLATVRTGRRRRYCPQSDQAGRAAGRALNLNQPLTHGSGAGHHQLGRSGVPTEPQTSQPALLPLLRVPS